MAVKPAASDPPVIVITLPDGTELHFPMVYGDAFSRNRSTYYGWVPDYTLDQDPQLLALFGVDFPPSLGEYLHAALYEGRELAGEYADLDWTAPDEQPQPVRFTLKWRIDGADRINFHGDAEPLFEIRHQR